jgi:hypothetical protein
MSDTVRLAVGLERRDDLVAVFEPVKVLQRLRRIFACVETDSIDLQRERLLRELDLWGQAEESARVSLGCSVAEPAVRLRFTILPHGRYGRAVNGLFASMNGL